MYTVYSKNNPNNLGMLSSIKKLFQNIILQSKNYFIQGVKMGDITT